MSPLQSYSTYLNTEYSVLQNLNNHEKFTGFVDFMCATTLFINNSTVLFLFH